MSTYYKVLAAYGSACHGGTVKWNLPTHKGRPGKWMPSIRKPQCCVRGYHVVSADSLLHWLDACDRQVWEAEIRGASHTDGDGKVAVESARLVKRLAWDAKIARAFACDCAERVLPIYEKEQPGDPRPRTTIEAARKYLHNAATDEELAAARAAAWAAAWAAARDAARDAEQQWQTARLLEYLNGERQP